MGWVVIFLEAFIFYLLPRSLCCSWSFNIYSHLKALTKFLNNFTSAAKDHIKIFEERKMEMLVNPGEVKHQTATEVFPYIQLWWVQKPQYPHCPLVSICILQCSRVMLVKVYVLESTVSFSPYS